MAVETLDFIAATGRMIKAAGRRVAEADEHELAALNELRNTIDEALHTAVEGQRASGRSWSHVGQALGMRKRVRTRTLHQNPTNHNHGARRRDGVMS